MTPTRWTIDRLSSEVDDRGTARHGPRSGQHATLRSADMPESIRQTSPEVTLRLAAIETNARHALAGRLDPSLALESAAELARTAQEFDGGDAA